MKHSLLARFSALRFRTQLALIMVASVLCTVAIGYGGLTVVGELQTQAMLAELSPVARSAAIKLEADQLPSQADLEVLMLESAGAYNVIDFTQNLSLVILSLIAAAIGAAVGTALAGRFSPPIEAVAAAARRIAEGDLSARAVAATPGSGETAQLLNDFNRMADELEGAERELVEGAAAIAHELRTPLTILRGRLQGMSDGVFPSGEKEISGLIRQVEGLGRIVEDLRVTSLAASGALELRKAPMDFAVEIDSVIEAMRPDLIAVGMAIELDLRPALIVADAPRLRQAAAALLENAKRYAVEGGAVRVEVKREPAGAVLRVLDRGKGLQPEELTRAFERFWRADPSRSREIGGSGLGLSVVAAIAQAHGGACRALQREGGGAVFELRVPG